MPLPDKYKPGSPLRYASFAGITNTASPERLAVADLVTGDNIDLTDDGQLHRRAGRVLKIAGDAHSLYADDTMLLAAVDGTLCQIAADWSRVALATVAGPVAYLRIGARIYWSDGLATGVVENGQGRSWGLPVPPLPAVTVGAGGVLSAGEIQYVMTWLRRDGQESGAGLVGRVTVSDGAALTFTFPAKPDPDILAANLYLSPPNGGELYFALSTVADNITYGYTTRELAYPLELQFLQEPPAGQRLAFYNGRAYVAAREHLQASQPFAYELFDPREYLPVDGTRIRLLEGLAGGLWIGTERGMYFAGGGDLRDLQLTPRGGAVAIEGAVARLDGAHVGPGDYTGESLLFLAQDGVWQASGDGQLRPLTLSRYQADAIGTGTAAVRWQDDGVQFLTVAHP